MNEQTFLEIANILKSRRPAWRLVIEDGMARILTQQFVVDWGIIDEILESKTYQLEEVISHGTFGLVICLRNVKGL